jgi:2-polyprenyl-3-methyl-5-hydroxy-6-metoxy-1,4-benzoquinol methylase
VAISLSRMTTGTRLTEREAERRDALADRIHDDCRSALELYCVYLGDRLGLYRALADRGAVTPDELAGAAGIHARYAREWLEQQAVAGILEVEDGRFRLPRGHAAALADRDAEAFSPPLARSAVALAQPLPALMDAFRTGGGVPWTAYGDDGREAQADMNRVQFLAHLGSEWLPAMPDVDARLREPGARVADLACGAGWSSIAIARAYPNAVVEGFDGDAASIELARANAAAEGLDERVRFQVRDVSAGEEPGGYQLVCVFEAIHDMSRPVEALAGMRALAAPDGAVLVMDERTNDELTIGDPLEHYLYSASVLGCLPAGMSEQPSAATGTVMRPATFAGYAREAGFGDVEVLDIEHDAFRFYRLR